MTDRYETFTLLISRINRNIRKIKNIKMAEYGLKSIHISCLYYLSKPYETTPGVLCKLCEEDKAAISRALDFLEEKGYVVPRQHEKKYKSPVLLTEEGKRISMEIARKIDGVLDEIAAVLSDEERESFYRSLALISDGLDKITKKL